MERILKQAIFITTCMLSAAIAVSCNSSKDPEAAEVSENKYIVDVQAHRGGMGLRPANTLEAMIHAVDLGVNTLELDLVVSKDGQIVMSHDKWFDYSDTLYPDGTEMKEEDPRVYLWHLDYEEISKYTVGAREMDGWPEKKCTPAAKPLLVDVIPCIEEYTKKNGLPPMKYNIEIKCDPDYRGGVEGRDWPMYNDFVDACVPVLQSLDLGDRLIVQCFDERALAYMHEKYPELHLSCLIGGGEIEWLENGEVDFDKILDRMGFVPEWFSPASPFVSRRTVEEAHRRGMKVVVWTVDTYEEIQRIIETGADAIISNYPDRLMEAVRFNGVKAFKGHNPISPMGVYIADPTARVWNDGRMYVYGSLDESPEHYCSDRYNVLSTSALKTWELKPYSFTNDDTIYAPDAWYKDGMYYLYYDTPDGSEYVAFSESPTGPFDDGVKIEGPQQIDPNIFIDDDGQAYYFWGQFFDNGAKGAKMNPDLKTLDWSTYVDGIVTEEEHFFHEGSFVFKRGDWYYFTYADISQNERPTSIGYAMSKSPLGPYEYKGVIINNAGCDPESWNNHGSVVQFGDQWYVLYHRSTHGSRIMRKACIEPIFFNEDGTINEVEMTSQGAAGPLDAFSQIDAAKACWMSGNVRIRRAEENVMREELGAIHNGDVAAWKYLDFGNGARKVAVKVKSDLGGEIILHAESKDGDIIGSVSIPADTGWKVYQTEVKTPAGVHALWLEFKGPEASEKDELFRVDHLQFAK